jgi:hypothetical protein
MISPERHRDHRENPSASREIAGLRLCASVAEIRAKQSQKAVGGGRLCKQSQSGQSGERAGSRRAKRAKRTQFGPGVQVPAGAIVQNEPNLGEVPACKAKPVAAERTEMGAGPQGREIPGGPNVQNEANCPRTKGNMGARLGRAPSGGRLCKTNPIWPAASGPRRAKCAKRTQFPAGRDTPAFHYSIIPAFHPSSIPSFPSTWTSEVDCANNGGLDRLRNFPGAR